MDRHPAAYLRRSFVDANSPGDISREAQRATVHELAAADGHNGNLVEYDDWGVSAALAKSAKRTEYTRLLADMEAGRVSDVYAFDLDRLYRDPRDLIRLQDAATRHRVTITTTAGRLAIGEEDDPSLEAFAFISAVFGRMELQKAKKRSRAGLAERVKRGDKLGKPGYGWRTVKDAAGNIVRGENKRILREPNPDEPLAPILAAVAEAGSYSGAATLLNAPGGPSPRHAAQWAGNTVRRVALAAATTPPAPRRPGRRSRHTWTGAALLRCPCGALLTARETFTTSRYGRFGPYVGYQCPKARYSAEHPRPYMIAEAAILPAIREEVARHILPELVGLEDAPDLGAERADLVAQRERLALAFARGGLAPDTYTAEDDAIAARIGELGEREEAETVAEVPPIRPEEWDSWAPADLNAYLRATLRRVRLGADMRPLPFTADDWRNPAARRP